MINKNIFSDLPQDSVFLFENKFFLKKDYPIEGKVHNAQQLKRSKEGLQQTFQLWKFDGTENVTSINSKVIVGESNDSN